MSWVHVGRTGTHRENGCHGRGHPRKTQHSWQPRCAGLQQWGVWHTCLPGPCPLNEAAFSSCSEIAQKVSTGSGSLDRASFYSPNFFHRLSFLLSITLFLVSLQGYFQKYIDSLKNSRKTPCKSKTIASFWLLIVMAGRCKDSTSNSSSQVRF